MFIKLKVISKSNGHTISRNIVNFFHSYQQNSGKEPMLNRERKKKWNQIRCDYYVPSWFSHFCHEHYELKKRKSMVALETCFECCPGAYINHWAINTHISYSKWKFKIINSNSLKASIKFLLWIGLSWLYLFSISYLCINVVFFYLCCLKQKL